MTVNLESLNGVPMITSDAFELGVITDIRYDPFDWTVKGLKVRSNRSSKLSAGIGKSVFLILPDDFVLNDVMIIDRPIDKMKDSVVPDNANIPSIMSLLNAKVITRDNALVGTVTTAMINTDSWKVSSLVVRLDKTAIEAMKMKKGLFSKISVEISTDLILSSADMVHLDEHMEGVREKMTVLE